MEDKPSKRFSRKIEDFTCEVCGAQVSGNGFTDHCPKCLWGKHVDVNPGDRAAKCGGLLRPMSTEHDRNSFFIDYRCEKCKVKKRFHASKEDDEELLFKILVV